MISISLSILLTFIQAQYVMPLNPLPEKMMKSHVDQKLMTWDDAQEIYRTVRGLNPPKEPRSSRSTGSQIFYPTIDHKMNATYNVYSKAPISRFKRCTPLLEKPKRLSNISRISKSSRTVVLPLCKCSKQMGVIKTHGWWGSVRDGELIDSWPVPTVVDDTDIFDLACAHPGQPHIEQNMRGGFSRTEFTLPFLLCEVEVDSWIYLVTQIYTTGIETLYHYREHNAQHAKQIFQNYKLSDVIYGQVDHADIVFHQRNLDKMRESTLWKDIIFFTHGIYTGSNFAFGTWDDIYLVRFQDETIFNFLIELRDMKINRQNVINAMLHEKDPRSMIKNYESRIICLSFQLSDCTQELTDRYAAAGYLFNKNSLSIYRINTAYPNLATQPIEVSEGFCMPNWFTATTENHEVIYFTKRPRNSAIITDDITIKVHDNAMNESVYEEKTKPFHHFTHFIDTAKYVFSKGIDELDAFELIFKNRLIAMISSVCASLVIIILMILYCKLTHKNKHPQVNSYFTIEPKKMKSLRKSNDKKTGLNSIEFDLLKSMDAL